MFLIFVMSQNQSIKISEEHPLTTLVASEYHLDEILLVF